MLNFEYENTWKHYRELALVPSINLFFDHVDGFYCLKFHFLSVAVAVTRNG